jgi:hypothetical protein
MNGEHGRNITQGGVPMAVLHHKWNERRMMIVHMYHIRLVLPLVYPIQNCDLESGESFGIIVVAIYLLTVQQTINVKQV